MKTTFYNTRLKSAIAAFQCETCQKVKTNTHQYAELPARDAHVAPWQEVAVDLIGPWTIRTAHGDDITFIALTVIDTATNLCEIIRLENKSAAHVGAQFEMAWLSRYPKPLHCTYDPGSEFLGGDFQTVLATYGIKGHATTAKNPQANAVIERVHQTIGNCIRALVYEHPPENNQTANAVVDRALAMASYAIRTAIHRTLKLSPGAIVFGRDMILNIPLIADFQQLRER